jgi:chorismate synthase
MSNSLGRLFRLTTFGESHGPQMGAIIDGCPAGLELNEDLLQQQLDRRKPGQSAITTQRQEHDLVKILSGVFEGKTTGTSIGLGIANKDQQSTDYNHLKDVFRPSHADYTYTKKYGVRDHRGGGRSSARETVNWVAGGAVASLFLKTQGVEIYAWVHRIKDIECSIAANDVDPQLIDSNIVRCPDKSTAERMIALIEQTRDEGNTVGGVIKCLIQGVPPGWGEPIFEKLEAKLAHAMLTINAVKGFEIGSGFSGTELYGSEHNDVFVEEEGNIRTQTNKSGGVQGGISNGENIEFNVAFKPVATLMRDQQTVDKDGNKAIVEGKGRHDPCVLPRAVPIVESMAALVLADCALLARANRV